MFVLLARSLRVYQWTKNLLVLAALVFAGELIHLEKVLTSLTAFLAFCFAASATYLFNDLRDIEQDRAHPEKRNRPIASGELTPAAAWVMLLVLMALAIALGAALNNTAFLGTLLAYLGLTVAYSMVLKNVVILDVLTVAMGFVLRAMAGAAAIGVDFSNWLVICTLFLALFLALSKRRQELTLLEGGAGNHRAVHTEYSVAFLDQLIPMMAGAALITYALYSCDENVAERFGTDKLYFTIPFVVFGLFRYLFLVHRRDGGGDPSATLLRDVPLGLTVILWAAACAAFIYV